ncbi:MAG: AbrB/MazE/SpoVT family DNA-binding domain-containing protein [Desulfobacterales bacterium]|jgi:AbrB family looped-hinge helix DNA binding protein
MALATVTSKGQVTIPKEVRDSLGLRFGDKIEIIITENGTALIRPISKKVDDIFGKLHKPGRKAASVEEMNQAIRQRVKDKFK